MLAVRDERVLVLRGASGGAARGAAVLERRVPLACLRPAREDRQRMGGWWPVGWGRGCGPGVTSGRPRLSPATAIRTRRGGGGDGPARRALVASAVHALHGRLRLVLGAQAARHTVLVLRAALVIVGAAGAAVQLAGGAAAGGVVKGVARAHHATVVGDVPPVGIEAVGSGLAGCRRPAPTEQAATEQAAAAARQL